MLKTKKMSEEHETRLDAREKMNRLNEELKVMEYKMTLASIGGSNPILCFSLCNHERTKR
ncbi:hypothetical protein [Bacillus sp. EAC]|uniref:hypothetical protein n=1 Tax=Bacillus sp. EAC TaxID=1978338 RepID=UPI000B449901|nr:hypothetical protein [Bacillus sp. EAC]